MTYNEIVIKGTLRADGTLELDAKPGLPPGRVHVVLRQDTEIKRPPAPLDDDFFRMMEEIWANQEARQHVPCSVEEVEAQRQQLRQEWEAEVETSIRLQEECRRLRASGKEVP